MEYNPILTDEQDREVASNINKEIDHAAQKIRALRVELSHIIGDLRNLQDEQFYNRNPRSAFELQRLANLIGAATAAKYSLGASEY